MIHRVGDEWRRLLNRVFRDRIGIENRFFFQKLPGDDEADGLGRYSFYATRYDYLRIGVAMLEDWTQDNCVGRYLKDLYEARKEKGHGFRDPERMTDVAKSYSGQFHMDFEGMRDRALLGLNGYGGQNILIDMDNRRIVVVNAAHTGFPWRDLVYDAIKNGALREE